MPDRREQILARLLQILEAQKPNAKTVARNEVLMDDDAKPALLLLDGNEEADDSDPRRRSNTAPRRVTMAPEIFIAVSGTPEEVGSTLNAWRARLLKAFQTDADLLALTSTTDAAWARRSSPATPRTWRRRSSSASNTFCASICSDAPRIPRGPVVVVRGPPAPPKAGLFF
jgi:hypothetical protein